MGSNAFEQNPGVSKVGAEVNDKLHADSMTENFGVGAQHMEKGAASLGSNILEKSAKEGINSLGDKAGESQAGNSAIDDFLREAEKLGKLEKVGPKDPNPNSDILERGTERTLPNIEIEKGDFEKPGIEKLPYKNPEDFKDPFRKPDFEKHIPRFDFDKVTPQDRTEAKQELQKMIPEILSDADRKALVSMQEAIIDGNVEKLGKSIASMKDDPAKLGKFANEINRELKEAGSDTRLTVAKDGRVFLSSQGGDLAVQFNADGSSEVKPVEYTRSGAMVVKPGEVVNRSSEDVGRGIGDSTTRDLRGDNLIKLIEGGGKGGGKVTPMHIENWDSKPKDWLNEQLKDKAPSENEEQRIQPRKSFE